MKRFSFLLLALLLPLFCMHSGAEAPQIDGLTFVRETPRDYAECFSLYEYEDGYTLISIPESGEYLVIPENGTIPAGLDSAIIPLKKPLDRIYLAATSAMALFDALDSVDSIRLTGAQASGWYIDSAVEALNSGDMLFAGRYSEPDYELLLREDCCLAIESTMIFHTPKVKEMIEDLEIPVLVDRSSYEPHPLGRTEWIKLYAVLTGTEAEADAFFREQAGLIESMENFPTADKTVAFFYVNSDGSVVVRNPGDYIPKMISLAGGRYLCPELSPSETSTSVSVTMESFYASAWDADFLIYNSSIDAPLDSLEELIGKDELFSDFTAVQNGNVWCTGKAFYQATDIVSRMILDVNSLLTEDFGAEMTFLSRVS